MEKTALLEWGYRPDIAGQQEIPFRKKSVTMDEVPK
jgi:hypothetical protein